MDISLESQKGNGVFNLFDATWKLNRIGGTNQSVVLESTGVINYQTPVSYPSTNLDMLQTTLNGNVFGDYNEPLTITLTRLLIVDSANPYFGKGFTKISYVPQSGQGEGWAYIAEQGDHIEDIIGVFSKPLAGIATGTIITSNPAIVCPCTRTNGLGIATKIRCVH